MSTNDNRNLDDQNIDLSVLSEKIGDLFQSLNTAIFKTIQFVVKHIVILVILFLLGFGIGMYLDKTRKIYDHEIIVQPNFGSTDYLYSKVELLSSKIKERDTLFLKEIGIKDPSSILSIKISPVIDIYKFITSNENGINEQNFSLLKLIAEDGDIKKIIEDEATSKNYTFHKISFTTNKLISGKYFLEPLLGFLNNSKYFNELRNVYIRNAQEKIIKNNEIIAQVDGFLNSNMKSSDGNKSDKLVYYNENTQLNDVIQTKNNLISETGRLQTYMVTIDKTIKESSISTNIKNTKSINGKLKMILPFLFIFLYMFTYGFINFYKKQALKNK